jgi:VWFA-related protein
MTTQHGLTAFVLFALALAARPDARPAPAVQAGSGVAPPAAGQPAARPGGTDQIPPVTFRVQVDYVEVDVYVTDRNGQPVRDLRREDFQVLEQGRPQNVELFSFVDIPIERAERPLFATAPIEPDVATNAREFDGRVYAILLDDLHTTPSRTLLVRAGARRFIERNLGANDMAAVIHLSGRTDASQDFTSSTRLLLRSVDQFMGRKLRSATLNRLDVYNQARLSGIQPRNGKYLDPEDRERGFNASATLRTMKNIAEFLDGVRGRRKSLILFSEGIDYNIFNPFDNADATTILDDTRAAIAAATRANVSVYAIDPRGLGGLSQEAMELTSLPEDPGLRLDGVGLNDELRLSQDSLRVLAEETGGFAAVNTNDFAGAYDRIVRENSSYYVLGYYPPDPKRDGRFRKIEVKVNRPGLEVRARKGYAMPKTPAEVPAIQATARTSPAVREAINSPLPQSGLTLTVQPAAFKGTAPNASVLLTTQVAPGQFRFTEQAGSFADTLEISFVALDDQGKVRAGDTSAVELKLREQTRQAVEAFGVRVMSRFELAPGRYQLRVAGRAASTGAVGVVHADLEIPDFSKAPFSMSGVLLTSGQSALTPTVRPDEQVKALLPAAPGTRREFRADDTIALFAEVYDNQAATPHKVDIATTLRADDGRVVFKTEEERESEEVRGARGGYGYMAQVPLKDIAPGDYVLRVEARSRLSGNEKTPAARDIEVRVRPAPPPRAAAAPAGPAPAAVVSVARGPQSGRQEAFQALARDEAEWTQLWASLPIRRAAPRVTFENTMIAAVFLGSRPTTGYSVEIVGAARDGDALIVQYVEHAPPASTMVAQVVTTPFAVAGVPRFDGPVRFERVEAPAVR